MKKEFSFPVGSVKLQRLTLEVEGPLFADNQGSGDTLLPRGSQSCSGAHSTPEVLAIAAEAVRLYAESHPRPLHVNKAQAAEMLEISRPTFDKLIRAGIIRLNSCGLIPVGEVDRALSVRETRTR